MKTIAIIEKNRCQFDNLEEFAIPLLYRDLDPATRFKIKTDIDNYLWAVIEPYVKFIDYDPANENFIEIACKNMTTNFQDHVFDEFFYHTEASYSFPKKHVEILYCQPLWKDYTANQLENMNNIACLFSLKQTVMNNTCIIIANAYDLNAERFTVLDSITKKDILRVIKRRFFFSAILVKNDQLIKYYYQNPSYLIQSIYGLTEKDNIEKLSFSHLKYNLLFYFKHDKSQYINQTGTRISGLYKLYGDVLILHEMEENVFANISIHEVKRLNVLSYGRLDDRQLKKEEIHEMSTMSVDENGKESEKKVTPFWSRYIVLNSRMLEWQKNKNKCCYCSKEIKKLVLCDKCYRARYCSNECLNDFIYHSKDCIN